MSPAARIRLIQEIHASQLGQQTLSHYSVLASTVGSEVTSSAGGFGELGLVVPLDGFNPILVATYYLVSLLVQHNPKKKVMRRDSHPELVPQLRF